MIYLIDQNVNKNFKQMSAKVDELNVKIKYRN